MKLKFNHQTSTYEVVIPIVNNNVEFKPFKTPEINELVAALKKRLAKCEDSLQTAFDNDKIYQQSEKAIQYVNEEGLACSFNIASYNAMVNMIKNPQVLSEIQALQVIELDQLMKAWVAYKGTWDMFASYIQECLMYNTIKSKLC